MEQYEKNLDVYAHLKPLQATALERARQRLSRLARIISRFFPGRVMRPQQSENWRNI